MSRKLKLDIFYLAMKILFFVLAVLSEVDAAAYAYGPEPPCTSRYGPTSRYARMACPEAFGCDLGGSLGYVGPGRHEDLTTCRYYDCSCSYGYSRKNIYGRSTYEYASCSKSAYTYPYIR